MFLSKARNSAGDAWVPHVSGVDADCTRRPCDRRDLSPCCHGGFSAVPVLVLADVMISGAGDTRGCSVQGDTQRRINHKLWARRRSVDACAGTGFVLAADLPLTDEEDEPDEEGGCSGNFMPVFLSLRIAPVSFVVLRVAFLIESCETPVVLCRPKAAERPPLRRLPRRVWTSMPPATSDSH